MAAENPTKIPSETQVLEWMNSLSNWGRWGDDDQLGCFNLITPAKRKAAAALVREGTPVSCARPILTEMAPDISFQVQRWWTAAKGGKPTHQSGR